MLVVGPATPPRDGAPAMKKGGTGRPFMMDACPAWAYQPRLMVWSRSGPTDTRLTRTPVSSSMRAM